MIGSVGPTRAREGRIWYPRNETGPDGLHLMLALLSIAAIIAARSVSRKILDSLSFCLPRWTILGRSVRLNFSERTPWKNLSSSSCVLAPLKKCLRGHY